VKLTVALGLALTGLSAFLIACGGPASPTGAAQPAVTLTFTPPPLGTRAGPAPTPARTSDIDWGIPSVSASEIGSKLATVGMKVESESVTSTPILGAQRQDVLRVDGERVSVFTFGSSAQASGVLAEVAAGRTTVLFLRTPYFVRIANVIVLITTDDEDAAARLIRALR
jgi:hypothetical protein